MSFSGEIKEEIARLIPVRQEYLLSELSAILRFSGELKREPGQRMAVVETENVLVAKTYVQLIKRAFDLQVQLEIRTYQNGKNHQYRIRLGGQSDAAVSGNSEEKKKVQTAAASESSEEKEMARTAAAAESGEEKEMARTAAASGNSEEEKKVQTALSMLEAWYDTQLRAEMSQHSGCRRAYIRGAFLAAGSMSDPGKSYHLEIVCAGRSDAALLVHWIEAFGIQAKIAARKQKYIVYLKDSTQIVNLLNVMEAHKSLMELENVRIIKEMRNSANRQSNCDSANISKIVRTAARQVEDIRYIEAHMGLEALPPALAEMARIRLDYPDVSLQELGTYLEPPVGKSGVNHRLRKLKEIAESLRTEEEHSNG